MCHSVNTRIAWLFVLALAFANNFAAAQDSTSKIEDQPYSVQPGDVLEISVWKEPDLQREVLVRPDGAFAFPLIGEVSARKKSVEELRVEIRERLERFIPDLVVTVMVKQVNGNRIYVSGQVKNPGSYVVNPSVNVMQALSLAGGLTAFAAKDEIRILRKEGTRQVAIAFKYSEVSKGRNLGQNLQLRAGDVVSVP